MKIQNYIKEIYGFAGLGLIGFGLFLFDPRLAYITVGALLFITALIASVRGK